MSNCYEDELKRKLFLIYLYINISTYILIGKHSDMTPQKDILKRSETCTLLHECLDLSDTR